MDHTNLKFQLVKNVGTLSITTVFSKIATIVTGVILARLLTPSDFGIYGIALSVMAFVLVVDEMGLRSAVIQKKTDDEAILFNTGFLIKCVLSGMLFLIILLFAAPLGAQFYKTSRTGSHCRGKR